MAPLRLTPIPGLLAPFLIAAACLAGMATPARGDDAALDPAPYSEAGNPADATLKHRAENTPQNV